MSFTAEPVTVKYESGNKLGKKIESHPSFGQVSFSRVSIGGCGKSHKLYGSHLANHQTTITLSIHRSEKIDDNGNVWYFPRNELIEVELSASQFAELLTTMNHGSGVPCTIRHLDGKQVPEIPSDEGTTEEKLVDSFKDQVADHVNHLKDIENQINKILDKPSIGKKDREDIKNLFSEARRFFIDHAPYLVQLFQEVTGKTATQAKAEVEAFMTQAIQQAGLKTLQNQFKELTDGE